MGRGAPARELLGDAFRDPEDVSRVLVVILHQRFVAERAALLFITEPLRDLVLDREVERVRGAARGVVQIGPETEEEIVGGFDPAPIRFAQPIFADQMRRGERAFLEEGHPKKVLVIAQAAATALQVRLLDVNAVAKFGVARRLVLHAHLHVFAFVSSHTPVSKGGAKTLRQCGVAGELPRFQHRGFRQHVRIREFDGLGD